MNPKTVPEEFSGIAGYILLRSGLACINFTSVMVLESVIRLFL